MSHYSRDSYRRRRQEEQMMFQRVAAEESQIQNFLLLQQDGGVTEFIGGTASAPNPEPGYSVNLLSSYIGSTGAVVFTSQNLSGVKQSVLYATGQNFQFSGQVLDAFDPIAVGTQLYIFNGNLFTNSGNYVKIIYGTPNSYEVHSISNGIITAITNFNDIP